MSFFQVELTNFWQKKHAQFLKHLKRLATIVSRRAFGWQHMYFWKSCWDLYFELRKMCAYLSHMIYLGLNNSFLSDFVGYHCYYDEIILVESNFCQIHLHPNCLSWWWYELPILNIGIIPRWGTHDSVMVPHLPKLVPIKGWLNLWGCKVWWRFGSIHLDFNKIHLDQ